MALDLANDDIWSIFGDDFVVVEHLEFLRGVSAHV